MISASETDREARPISSHERLEVGSRVGGFTIKRYIASGGFGSVYEADGPGQTRAAVKVLHPELAALGDPFLRFLREARVLDLLHHHNVVAILDSGLLPDGRAYLATEMLDGRDLEEHVELVGPLSIDSAIGLLAPICEALDAAHAAGIVHRDIKASNVFLVDPKGERRVVLLDFGLAKVIEAGGVDLTSSRMALGTPSSMAPEQIRGGTVDGRADVYGVGALAYFMLTGRLAFGGMSPSAVRYMHLFGQRPRASTLVKVNRAVDEVIARAMSAAPEDRFASPGAFHTALCRAAAVATAVRPAQSIDSSGIAIYVEVQVIGDDDSTGGSTLAEMESVLDIAERQLAKHQFHPVIEHSNSTLFARALDPGSELSLRDRREAALAAVQLSRQLTAQPSDTHVNICLNAAPCVVEDGRVVGGELVRVDRWAPQTAIDGVIGSAKVFEGLDVEVVPSDGAGGWLRITTPGVGRVTSPDSETSRQRELHSEMMAQIGRRASSIVHEMRAPLTAMIWNLQSVVDAADRGESIGDRHLGSLREALEAALRLKEAASGVLDASSVKSYSDSRRPVAVSDLVDSAIRLVEGGLRTKATISVYHESSAFVLGARGRLIQVLVNLLTNAIAAIGEFGNIELRSELGDPGTVKLSVRDTGCGIATELQDRIFERYFTTKEVEQGTGLGLAIARQIVEDHGGSIAVFSAPGAGSCFAVTLPTVTTNGR